MNQVQTYYKHSGNTTFLGMLLLNLAGLASVMILGAIYGYALWYIPFIYLKIVATVALGGLLGWLIGLAGKMGHIRNKWVLYYFGILFGIGAVYMGWVFWIFISSKQTLMILNPRVIWLLLERIAVRGAWSLGGVPVHGFLLYLIWFMEAFIIIGVSTWVAGKVISKAVYCETCQSWIKPNHTVYPLEPVGDISALKFAIEKGDFSTLFALKKINLSSRYYTHLELTLCPGCEMFHLLTVTMVATHTNKKGQEKEKRQAIIKNFIITPGTYQMLLALDKPVDEPVPNY